MEKIFLNLGCHGRRDDDFIFCPGIENRILHLDNHIFHYNEIMDYLDSCSLFDKPLFDFNSVRHVIHNLQDRFDQPTRKLWKENKFQLYQKFVIDHRTCGVFLRLELFSGEKEEQQTNLYLISGKTNGK